MFEFVVVLSDCVLCCEVWLVWVVECCVKIVLVEDSLMFILFEEDMGGLNVMVDSVFVLVVVLFGMIVLFVLMFVVVSLE